MARAKPVKAPDVPAMGPIVAWNLYRLGHADIVVRASEIAASIREKTGKPMTRQRVSALMNAARIEPETLATLASAIGVEPAELTKRD